MATYDKTARLEYMREWRAKNSVKIHTYAKTWAAKQPSRLCRHCGAPARKWAGTCSSICAKTMRAERMKAVRDAVMMLFLKHKEEIGCNACGFNKYGGALDYHHIDPTEKTKRVAAMEWHNGAAGREIQQCVLLCKNCHYIEHQRIRDAEVENGTIE